MIRAILKLVKVESLILSTIILLSIVLRYYHSFYIHSTSYGSGDAFGVILNARLLDNYKESYLISYLFRVLHEVTELNYLNIAFFITPIISSLIILVLFSIVKKLSGSLSAIFSAIFIATNPWISYYSTEPDKGIFVILYLLISIFCLLLLLKYKNYIFIVFSIFFFAIGSIYYHSLFVLFPFYLVSFLLILTTKKRGIKLLNINIKHLLFLILIFIIVVAPFYLYKQTQINKFKFSKPAILKTEVDIYKNIFERQAIAVWQVLTTNRDKLGYESFKEGIQKYLLSSQIYQILVVIFITLSLLIYLLTGNKSYIFVSSLIIYLFIIFSLSWVSYSHSSRYPVYIVFFIYTSLGMLFGLLLKTISNKYIIQICVTLIFLIVIILNNPFLYVAGYRNLYVPQLQAGTLFLKNNLVIDKNHQVLYLSWPAITYSLIDKLDLKDEKYFHSFGFNNVNLEAISSRSYIDEHKIQYFIYDQTATDYFDSSNIVLRNLQKSFELILLDKVDDQNHYLEVYKLAAV